jgi:hypothetical protein
MTRFLLGRMRGQDIAAAAHTLPACGPDARETMTADVDAEHVGRVRITFTKFKHTHLERSQWFWAAASAALLDEHRCDKQGRSTTAVDGSYDPPMTGIYPTCSMCGEPQGLGKSRRPSAYPADAVARATSTRGESADGS